MGRAGQGPKMPKRICFKMHPGRASSCILFLNEEHVICLERALVFTNQYIIMCSKKNIFPTSMLFFSPLDAVPRVQTASRFLVICLEA